MGFFGRLFGICRTPRLDDPATWRLSSGTLEIDVEKVGALQAVGSAVRLEAEGLPARVLVVHGVDGNWYAYENRCTHMGRRIDPLEGEPQLQCCSVGKSAWDYEGQLVGGSAKLDLRRFPAARENGTLRIDLSPPS